MGRGFPRRRVKRRPADPRKSKAESWRKRASEVFERDGYRCRALTDPLPRPTGDPTSEERCRRRATLQAHHLLNRSQGGKDHPDNLLTLCADHHTAATLRKEVFYRDRYGLLARAWRLSWEAEPTP